MVRSELEVDGRREGFPNMRLSTFPSNANGSAAGLQQDPRVGAVRQRSWMDGVRAPALTLCGFDGFFMCKFIITMSKTPLQCHCTAPRRGTKRQENIQHAH